MLQHLQPWQYTVCDHCMKGSSHKVEMDEWRSGKAKLVMWASMSDNAIEKKYGPKEKQWRKSKTEYLWKEEGRKIIPD